MLLQLLGIFAEFERGVLIDRITKGFERKAARGEWLAGRAPFGYQLDTATKSLVVDPKEATVVQAIFTAYADGHLGAKAIALQLNEAGRRNRNHRLWTNQALLHLLHNPAYIGKIAHGDDVYDAKHEPIVDADVFDRAQTLLATRSAIAPIPAPTMSEYTVGSATHCTECQGAFVGAGGNANGRFYRYYICRRRHTAGGARVLLDASPGRRPRARGLQPAPGAASQPPDVRARGTRRDRRGRGDRPRLEAELASVEGELRETVRLLDRYVAAFESESMPPVECAPRVAELAARRDELVVSRDQLKAALDTATPRLPTEKELAALRAVVDKVIDSGTPDQKKQLVAELVKRIDITPDRRATPYFRVLDMNRPGLFAARACNGTTFRTGSRKEVGRRHSYSNLANVRQRLDCLRSVAEI